MYYIVEGLPIFFTRDTYHALNNQALKNMSPGDRIRRHIKFHGEKVNKQEVIADKLIYEYLKEKIDRDFLKFKHEWYEYYLEDYEGIQRNIYTLLQDVSQYYRKFEITNVTNRSEDFIYQKVDRITIEYSFNMPKRLLIRQSEYGSKIVTLPIQVDQIETIEGIGLKEFSIIFKKGLCLNFEEGNLDIQLR